MAIIRDSIVDVALTVDAAKNGTAFDLSSAESLAVMTTASSASTPSGTTIQLFGSIDGTNFVALGSTVSVTGNGNFFISAADCALSLGFKWGQIRYARSSGSYVANTRILIKGASI